MAEVVELVRPILRYRTGYGQPRKQHAPRGRRETKTDCSRFDGPRQRCVAAMLAGDMQAYGEACAELRALLAPTKPDGRKVPHAGHFNFEKDHGLDRL